ncbi:MAG: tetratricopeptide repeat protein [Planctomycetia bacterium]|nr:MAG: tetratricopeptide repeat protein [Planctomycetia bacterium]
MNAPAATQSREALWQTLLIGGAIVVATLVAYVPALQAGVIWDDDSYLTRNPLVQAGWDGLRRIWFTTESPQYYPLVFTTFWLEHKLWGLAPFGYHLVNVLLHAANALLVWRIARMLNLPAAAVIGAVFALHPVHVESVAWITERKNVLSGLFFLLALRAMLRWNEGGGWRSYAAGTICFIAALGSKSVTAMLAPTLPLLFGLQRGRLSRAALVGVLPLILIGAAKGLLTAHLEADKVGASGAEWSQTIAERVTLIAPSAYVFYAQKVLWPHPLLFVYPRWDLAQADATWYVPLGVSVAALVVAVVGRRRWGNGPLVAILFAAFNLFPALGFLNVYPHRYSFVADHFQYIGSLGFIALFVGIGAWLLRARVAAPIAAQAAIAVAVCAALGSATFAQSRIYESERTLYVHTLRHNPNATLALINYANILREDANRATGPSRDALRREAMGLFERAAAFEISRFEALSGLGATCFDAQMPTQAIEHYEKAMQVAPRGSVTTHNNLALALDAAGRTDEALAMLDQALREKPDAPTTWFNLSTVLLRAGRTAEAATAAGQACSLAPQAFGLRVHLARVLTKAGRNADAADAYEQALAQRPDAADVRYERVLALFEAGRYELAVSSALAELKSRPSDLRMMTQLIWMLSVCPQEDIRDAKRAQSLAAMLSRGGTDGAPSAVLDALAAAAAADGDFGAALRLVRSAIEMAQREGNAEREAAARAREALYTERRPFVHTPRP